VPIFWIVVRNLAIPLLTEAINAQTAMIDTNSPELAASEALLGSAFRRQETAHSHAVG
jgi:hypothetical protein